MNLLLQFIAAFFGTISFAVIFEVPKKYYIYSGAIGAAGWMIYLFVLNTFNTPIIAIFVSSLILLYLSREISYKLKAPVTIFLLCGIFCLAPGLGLYKFTYAFFTNNEGGVSASSLAVTVLKSAIAISFGIAIGYELPPQFFYFYRKMNKKNKRLS
ncbi:hypothetical protein BG261_05690 [Floricoccus tropicus]|uniref:Threonine/Serine exporter ThrE domain-containing protein n=1 Tax=Floricoccus tropicus TaxID=1859473 RepID=A0A1E8GMY0_9LACT|nr:threonine/serine exporter family protein [Floricoccus tropicus]OFI48878.1 hypothetical protein BG261_05690 [Floricoccus tropicus]